MEEETPATISTVRMKGAREACRRLPSCERYVRNARQRLVGRYIGRGGPGEGQVVAAVIDLRGRSYDDYIGSVKRLYKGNVIRDARKSDRQGFTCKPFVRAMCLPDIVAINRSKPERCGKPMRNEYLKTVEAMGGAPAERLQLAPPDCPEHYDIWWGVFAPSPGHVQGDVVTDERLLAYIDLRRLGSLALYSLILGHGEYLQHGIMYRLHFTIMEWILKRQDAAARGIEFLMYAGYHQGSEGLKLWKKKTGFEPARLVDGDGAGGTGPAFGREVALRSKLEGIWKKLKGLI